VIWRAVAAFVALPGVVGFVVPWMLRPDHPRLQWWGLAPLGVGSVLLLWCVRDFYVAGHGTLAPWAPPERLVVVGLYRLTRNPMYVAVDLILCGWAISYGSPALWIYAACVAVAFHLRVVFYEEPWLNRTQGESWQAYRARVPRWLGRPRRRAHQERRPQ
jgi:protein-S-isoprenylcysteine O-methyltransferase Ste14